MGLVTSIQDYVRTLVLQKWFTLRKIDTHFDLLIYMIRYLLLSVLDKHWTLVHGPQGFYYSPWRDSYPASPAISRPFKDTNTKQRSYLDSHYDLEDDLSSMPKDSNDSGNASKRRPFCVFRNTPGCIHLRIY